MWWWGKKVALEVYVCLLAAPHHEHVCYMSFPYSSSTPSTINSICLNCHSCLCIFFLTEWPFPLVLCWIIMLRSSVFSEALLKQQRNRPLNNGEAKRNQNLQTTKLIIVLKEPTAESQWLSKSLQLSSSSNHVCTHSSQSSASAQLQGKIQ